MNTQEFFDTVERVFHDWHYDHPRILYALIRALKPQTVIEIGTYRGYAACYMARALQENKSGHLYCIDNFSWKDHIVKYGDPVDHWNSNLLKCGVRGGVVLLRGDSDKVRWPDVVDFAYIDGMHSYIAAKFDFEQCDRLGATCICLDDTLHGIGPRKLVAELDQSRWTSATIPNNAGLTICHRKSNRRVTFSQELPGGPGVDITIYSDKEISEHLVLAAASNGVDYEGFDPGSTTAPSATAGAS